MVNGALSGIFGASGRRAARVALRAVAFSLSAGLLSGGAGSAGAADERLADLIPRIKPSLVGVGTFQELRRPPASLNGTGFVAGDGSVIVTNVHVISSPLDREHNERLVIFEGSGDNVRLVEVSIAATDPAHDVAILKLAQGRLKPLGFGAESQAREGTPIAFTGFPIGAVLGLYPVTHRGIISARTPVAVPQSSPGQLDPKMIKRLREHIEVLQLDATAYPGNSGSPMYDASTGEVYGIVSSVFVKETKENVLSEPSGITYAVPIRYAQDLLTKIRASGK